MGRRSYNSSSSSSSSTYSAHTQSTARTAYSDYVPYKKLNDYSEHVEEAAQPDEDLDRRASVVTYASTNPSEEDVSRARSSHAPSQRKTVYRSDAVPASPPDFAELFPSTRQLYIRHDDSTPDGNMNLRVDTEISTTKGRRVNMTLFHLRMSDLHERTFSLRRYCRDSGREVCHSAKKYTKPALSNHRRRPLIQRSLSSALHSIGKKTASALQRYDSGYESDDDDDVDQDLREFTALSEVKATVPTDTIRLEFSNYAQVEVVRGHPKSGKTHVFEYWGKPYQWQQGASHEAPYDLIDLASGKSVAELVPQLLTRREALQEELEGAWIPPCSLRITDRTIANDVKADLGDVIVATGLVSLVDDCIKRRWHSSSARRLQRTVSSDEAACQSQGYTRSRR